MASDVRNALSRTAFAGLWLFAAVACLSIAAQNLLFVGFAAWVLQRRPLRVPPSLKIWGVFVAWALLASFLSDNSSHSLFTWKKWLLGFTVIYVAGAPESRRDLNAHLGALLFFGGLSFAGAVLWALRLPLGSGLGLHAMLAQWAVRGEWRAVSGSGGYMVLGSCSMLLFVFFSGLAVKDPAWRRPIHWVCLLSAALALLMTQTRSAWLGALAGSFALLWIWRKGAALGLVALLAALLLLFPASPVSRRVRDGLDVTQNSARERIFMARTGLAILKEHPWIGVGDALESFDGHQGYYLNNFPPDALGWESLRGKDEGHLHNDFLQLAVMYGIPGLALLLMFFVPLGLKAAFSGSALGVGLGAALLAWFVNGLFEYNFGSFQSSFVLWFLIGLYFAGVRLEQRTSD